MNDPLNLFGEASQDNDPLGLFAEEAGKKSSFLDTLAGLGEETLALGTGFAATPIAGLAGLSATLAGGLEQGVSTQEAVQRALTYQPRTARGQELTEAAGRILDLPGQYGEKAGGAVGGLIGGDVGERTGAFLGRVGGEFATDLIPVGGAVAAVKARRGAPKEAPRPRVEEAARALETRGDPLGLFEQGELFPRVEEGLATPYEAGQMGVTEPVAPKLQRRQMELPFGEERGPLVADIQGQVFRGDVSSPEARLALEGQAKAFRQEMEAGRVPDQLKAGEPLPALQDPSFLDALRKEYLEAPAKINDQIFETLEAQKKLVKQQQMDQMYGERTPEKMLERREQIRRAEFEADRLTMLEEQLRKGRSFNARTRRQGGAINLEVLNEGYQKLKELSNGVRLWFVGDPYAPKVLALNPNGTEAGILEMSPTAWNREAKASDDLTAMWVDTEGAPGRNLAQEMYRFAAEQGNDIVQSGVLTEHGRRMWDKFERVGLAQQGRIRKQGGGILFDWKDNKKVDKLKNIGGLKQGLKNVMPSELSIPEAIEAARAVPDVEQNLAQKAINLFTKGGQYMAIKVDHPIVKATVDRVLDADRLARADIRDYIHDSLAPAMRDLSKKEQGEVFTLLNAGDLTQREVTQDLLDQYGFNEKQKRLVVEHRRTMDYVFDQINRARAAVGKDPIDKRVAYASMQATGDYRRLVYKEVNGEKEVVGILGARTRWGLDKLQKQFENKGYTFGEERFYGNLAKEKRTTAQSAVMQALEHLAENNPHTKEFLDIIRDEAAKNAYAYLNAKKHALGKKGVFGMEGRKQWQSVEENAKDFLDSQLRYAETGIKWGHMSDAAAQVKELLASDANAPNAKKLSENYLYNALGMNPMEAGRDLESAVNRVLGATGIGVSIPARTQMLAKKLTNTLLLGLNPGFLAANIIQPAVAMPGMNAWLKQQGLTEISLMTMGYDSVFKGGITAMKEITGSGLSSLEKGAVDYAKKYHVYGSDLVDTSILSRKNAEFYLDKMGNFLASNIESATRRMMYYGFVHLLDAQKRFKPDVLYKTAHNLTDMAMNNYAPIERPAIFNAMGPIGDLAANLSSFKFNELSRVAMFAREMGNDKAVSPLLIQLATGVAAAGLTGTLAFQEADWLYKQLMKSLGKPDSLTQRAIELSEKVSPKGTPEALSHGLFSFLGVDMSKRLGLSDVVPNSLFEAMFPGGGKLVDVAVAGMEAVKSPSEMSAKRFARELAPGVLTGPMDLAWFSKQTPAGELALNRRTLEGQVFRTEADRRAKLVGLTGIKESVAKQKLYEVENIDKAYADLRTGVLKKAKDQMFSKGRVSEDLINKYIDYEGDPSSLERELVDMVKKQSMSAIDAAKLTAAMSKSLPQQKRGLRLMESFKQ